jgi:hypothetical protein
MLGNLKTGNRFSETILGCTHSLSFAEVENQLEMEFIGQLFKANKSWLKDKANKQLKEQHRAK